MVHYEAGEVSEHRRSRRKRRLRYEAGVGERRGADDASKVADDEEGGGLARKSKVSGRGGVQDE